MHNENLRVIQELGAGTRDHLRGFFEARCAVLVTPPFLLQLIVPSLIDRICA
jgi:hypothetical protein